MDLVVIAQIITGTATLIVAVVLLYQLRQQHKDSEIQISMMSETLNERLFKFGNFDKEYYDHLSRLKTAGIHEMGRNISVGLKYNF